MFWKDIKIQKSLKQYWMNSQFASVWGWRHISDDFTLITTVANVTCQLHAALDFDMKHQYPIHSKWENFGWTKMSYCLLRVKSGLNKT